MITRIQGDLLEWPNGANVLLQICNTLCKMRSGLAKNIVAKYPEVEIADNEAGAKYSNILGTFSVATLSDGKKVVNAYAQASINRGRARNRCLNYEALYTVLNDINKILVAKNKKGANYILQMPALLGCDRAGGDVRILNAMLEVIFGESPLQVYVVEYNK